MTTEEYVESIKLVKIIYNDMNTEFTAYEYTEEQLINEFNAGKKDTEVSCHKEIYRYFSPSQYTPVINWKEIE